MFDWNKILDFEYLRQYGPNYGNYYEQVDNFLEGKNPGLVEKLVDSKKISFLHRILSLSEVLGVQKRLI